MNLVEHIHSGYIQKRRVQCLVDHLEQIIPRDAAVLDIGCGDGHLAALLSDRRPDIAVEGLDVLKREHTAVPVREFDGVTIPYKTRSVDVVMFIDVLHHVDDPVQILREALRVSKGAIVIKDHLCDGWLARATLEFMDRVGNARYGVAMPGNYWPMSQWENIFQLLGLKPVAWRQTLQLYPRLLDLFFGRTLHFLTKLEAAP
jgi:SAM-dependent methyltransferase